MEFLSIRAAARAIGVHENTIRNWVRSGVITNYRTLPGSGYRRIAASEVERLRDAMSEPDSD